MGSRGMSMCNPKGKDLEPEMACHGNFLSSFYSKFNPLILAGLNNFGLQRKTRKELDSELLRVLLIIFILEYIQE